MIRILACGSRDWTDSRTIRMALEICIAEYGDIHLIHGACRGADLLSQRAALDLEQIVTAFPARWERHGKAAGPIRNVDMLKIGKPSLVLAFHANIAESKGTGHMIGIAKEAGVPVIVIENRTSLETLKEQLPCYIPIREKSTAT